MRSLEGGARHRQRLLEQCLALVELPSRRRFLPAAPSPARSTGCRAFRRCDALTMPIPMSATPQRNRLSRIARARATRVCRLARRYRAHPTRPANAATTRWLDHIRPDPRRSCPARRKMKHRVAAVWPIGFASASRRHRGRARAESEAAGVPGIGHLKRVDKEASDRFRAKCLIARAARFPQRDGCDGQQRQQGPRRQCHANAMTPHELAGAVKRAVAPRRDRQATQVMPQVFGQSFDGGITPLRFAFERLEHDGVEIAAQ